MREVRPLGLMCTIFKRCPIKGGHHVRVQSGIRVHALLFHKSKLWLEGGGLKAAALGSRAAPAEDVLQLA